MAGALVTDRAEMVQPNKTSVALSAAGRAIMPPARARVCESTDASRPLTASMCVLFTKCMRISMARNALVRVQSVRNSPPAVGVGPKPEPPKKVDVLDGLPVGVATRQIAIPRLREVHDAPSSQSESCVQLLLVAGLCDVEPRAGDGFVTDAFAVPSMPA